MVTPIFCNFVRKSKTMNKVKVLDRNFTVSIKEAEILKRVAEIGAQISRDTEGKKPLFLVVLNGSFMFASDLMKTITTPCEISFVKLASYEGTNSSGNVKQLIGLNESLRGRCVVIVEDIIDSGLTMQELLKLLKEYEPSEVRIASLLVKPANLQVNLTVDYTCFEIPNDFIIGYGLDYDGEARNLRDIYTVCD